MRALNLTHNSVRLHDLLTLIVALNHVHCEIDYETISTVFTWAWTGSQTPSDRQAVVKNYCQSQRQTGGQTDRLTDREIDRNDENNRQIGRQIDR